MVRKGLLHQAVDLLYNLLLLSIDDLLVTNKGLLETGAEGFIVGSLFDHALGRLELFLHGGFKLLQVFDAGLAGFAFLEKAGRIDHGDFAGGAAGRRKYEHEAQSDSADSTHGNSIRKEVQRRRNPATGDFPQERSRPNDHLTFFPRKPQSTTKDGIAGRSRRLSGMAEKVARTLRKERALSPAWKNARAT